jgi:hypothetical protein
MRFPNVVWTLVAAALVAGCSSPRRSTAGFRLPDGDVARGKAAFVSLKCHTCHAVFGTELPAPVADPPVGVVLGGLVTVAPTDGDLLTAIVDPSHDLSHRMGNVASAGLSRMGDFRESMTVQQLIDLVAFLQSVHVVDRMRPAGIAG